MLSSFINTNIARAKKFTVPAAARRFMAHNRRVFSPPRGTAKDAPVVLFELSTMQSGHISYSYLANALAALHGARIEAYLPVAPAGWKRKLLFGIWRTLGLEHFGIYRSFGTSGFFAVKPDAEQQERARSICAQLKQGLRTLRDLEDLTIDGIWVGDLIYDTYLMRMRKPTVDLDAADFQGLLQEMIEAVVFWGDYLDKHDVRGINVSHCVYDVAIPLRMAVRRDIPVYQVTATHLYRLTQANLFAYNDFFYYRERFAALPRHVREAGIAEAKRRIDRRFAGEVGVDMSYSTKSAYGASRHAQLLKPSPRKKVLIATHCFFDSPHSYGNNIFPDFYEWLDFLGRVTEVTDYDWYIKTHPDFLPGTKEIIDAFVAKYPKFTLLPSDASHHQIIAEGIDLALTTYGTIAFEYAALGLPVINASQCNPHIAYDFNLHAKDADDYRRMLVNAEWGQLKIDKTSVYEYYFMRNIYNTQDLFFRDYDQAVEDLGGYYGQFTPAVYDRWLAEWTPERHQSILAGLKRMILSQDFRMDYTHYGRDFRIEPVEARA